MLPDLFDHQDRDLRRVLFTPETVVAGQTGNGRLVDQQTTM